MATFQIRRGSSSSKGTLSYGEPYFNADSQSVVFGASGSEEITLVKLNTGASSTSKWSGDLANSGSLSLTGDITASNAYFRGDVFISGSIQLGDNAVQDTITVIADFNSDLVPNDNSQYNLGSGGKYWKRLYATTASIDEITAVGNVTSFSSSLDSRINSLNSTTASLNSYTASNNSNISAIHTSTASLNSFTSSINTTIKTKLDTEGVISGSSQISFTGINGYPTYSSSVATFVNATSGAISSSVAAYNSVQDGKINSTTSSFQSYSSSINSFTASVNSTTSSQNGRLNSLETNSGSLNTFSSSVAAGIEFTGSNVTIKGNFLVKGTTTTVNSTTIEAGDNIISLNGTGASNAGLVVRDASGASTISGSLLWDTTNDYWIGGKLGSEEKIILSGEFTTFSSSAHNRLSSLETESGSIRSTLNSYSSSINSYTASNNTNISAIHTATASLNSFTSSINTTIKNKLNTDSVVSGSSQITITSTTGYTTFSSSIAAINAAEETRLNNLEIVSGTFFAYTASNNDTNSTQNSRISSLEISSASVSSFTSSATNRLNSLESESGSIRSAFNVHTSSYLVASSSLNTRVGALETFSSSLNASYVSEVEFAVWSGSIHSFTASVNSTTSSQNSRLNALETTSASLNIATASLFVSSSQLTASLSQISQSFNYRINQFVAGTGFLDAFTFEGYTASLETYTSSIDGKINSIHIATSSLNSFTSSQNSKNTALFTTTASLNTATASLNSYTASNTTNINAIHTFTASVNLNNAALNTASASLNSYTSSLKTAIETTGSNVTIIGNLLVKGTTTQVDSTTLNIGDNIIQLNAAGTSNGGLVVRDATGGSTTSGSLLWDVTNDYWKAGVEGSEQKIVLEGVLNAYTASNNTNISAIHTSTASLNSYTASNNTTITTQNNRLGSLETESGSIRTAFNSFTSSVNSTTSSQNSRLTTIEGRYATTGSNIFNSNQTISGSLTITQDLIVQGSSSIQNISSSNLVIGTSLVTLNTFSPSARYAGISVIDSGSSPLVSGSFLFDSQDNEWIFVHKGGASVTSSIMITGPETYDSLGNETSLTTNRIPKTTNKYHIVDSNISDNGSIVSINSNTQVTGSLVVSAGITGQINSTNGVVSGSSQIDATATTNWASGIKTQLNSNSVVSGSTQITSLLPVGAVSGSSQIDATATTNWASGIKTQLNSNTVISGSSQVAIASTTGFGTYLNQGVLTTSNVQFNSLGIGMAASATAGRIDATNDVVAYSSSDRRFKTNIVQIGSPIQKIKEIGGYEFDWIPNVEHGYKGHDVGVIAQEIEAVVPELVQTRESGYKAVKYDKLVALLIEGIKEQQTTIEKLEARISKLEGGE